MANRPPPAKDRGAPFVNSPGGSSPTDGLEFEPVYRASAETKGKGRRVMLTLIVLVGGGALAGWYMFDRPGSGVSDTNVPILRASRVPFKVRPQTPGGMAVPNRDKLVYERLGTVPGEDEQNSVPENLLAPAEKPLPKPEPLAAQDQPAVKTVTVESLTATPPPAKAVKPAQPSAAPDAITAPEAKVVAKTPTVAPAAPVAQPVKPSGFRVQLAAVRSPVSAKAFWARLKKQHSDLLGGLTLELSKVDLGNGKGILHRLRVGTLADEVAARKLCAALAKRKVGCLVIRPGA